jgi:integrase
VDRKYLDRHGQQWRVRVKVPELARRILGKSKLVEPLHTDSLAIANRLKHGIVQRLKEQIARAEVEARRQTHQPADPLLEEAFAWRRDIEREAERTGPQTVEDRHGNVVEVIAPDTPIADALHERAEEIERSEGAARSSTFFKVARGLETPVTSLVGAWLAERADMKPRQQSDYRRAVSRFEAWLAETKLPGSIEAVDRKAAGRYVSAMVTKGQHWKTSNKDISALSGYWKWLVRKGHCEANIWAGQSRPKVKDKGGTRSPRPFTDAEVATLVSGLEPADDPPLYDAMLIGALTGMRLEEIHRLTVADCAKGLFRIRDAKTEAGVRDVPIHPGLRGLVALRIKGKAPGAYLLHDVRDPKPGSLVERGQVIGKRFFTLRNRLGVNDKVEGQRQSRITFHSFRRWFINKAREALHKGAQGYDPWTIADVVGHDRESLPEGLAMTMGRYPGGSSLDAKRACVEAVRLPRRGRNGSPEHRSMAAAGGNGRGGDPPAGG